MKKLLEAQTILSILAQVLVSMVVKLLPKVLYKMSKNLKIALLGNILSVRNLFRFLKKEGKEMASLLK